MQMDEAKLRGLHIIRINSDECFDSSSTFLCACVLYIRFLTQTNCEYSVIRVINCSHNRISAFNEKPPLASAQASTAPSASSECARAICARIDDRVSNECCVIEASAFVSNVNYIFEWLMPLSISNFAENKRKTEKEQKKDINQK